MKLIIEDGEGRRTVVPVVRDEITIGRGDENVIKLTERNVSRRHARLKRENGTLLIEDLGSYNGVRINGKRISEATPINEGDLIEIGDYDLAVEGRFEVARPDDVLPPRATFPPSSPPAPPPEPASIGSATEIIGASRGGMFMLSPESGETRPAPPEIASKPQQSRQQAETKTRQRKLPLVVAAAGAGLAVGIAIASLLVTKASAHTRWEPPRSTAATRAPP
jgi:pSer/pThr/pTyr-binding forkhead associated (FHA) protein